MEVDEIRLGNALFNKRLVKSLFFVGEPIQICMKGRFRRNAPSNALKDLQSSVHGDVQLVGDLVKIKYPFCKIKKDGCLSMRPGFPQCEESVQAGQEFCFCTVLKEVPTSPDVDADVYWKILRNEPNPETCEKEFDVDTLRKEGKTPLACVLIPATVKNNPPNFFISRRAEIPLK